MLAIENSYSEVHRLQTSLMTNEIVRLNKPLSFWSTNCYQNTLEDIYCPAPLLYTSNFKPITFLITKEILIIRAKVSHPKS